MELYHYTMEQALEVIIDYRGKTPKKSETGIATLSAKSVKNGYIDYSECYYISKDEYTKFMVRGMPKIGDVLLTTEAPMGMVAKLDRNDVCVAQRLLTLRGKEGVLDNDFLCYYLQSPVGQHKLIERESGTTVTGIKQAEFKKIEIDIPSIEVQKKIAKCLKSLDTAIDINNRINKNINSQIKSISNAWFNNHMAFGGSVPNGWTLHPLSDIAEFVSGYSYKGSELTESTTAMATIKNFERKGGFKIDGFKEITPSSKLKKEQEIEIFDTIVAHTDLTQNADVIGNAEQVLTTNGYNKLTMSMDLVKVTPKGEISKFLIACILRNDSFKKHCLGYVNGTTVLHLSKKALNEYSLYLPSDIKMLDKLNLLLEQLYKELANNIEENINLLKIKESLLPKLISGKIESAT